MHFCISCQRPRQQGTRGFLAHSSQLQLHPARSGFTAAAGIRPSAAIQRPLGLMMRREPKQVVALNPSCKQFWQNCGKLSRFFASVSVWRSAVHTPAARRSNPARGRPLCPSTALPLAGAAERALWATAPNAGGGYRSPRPSRGFRTSTRKPSSASPGRRSRVKRLESCQVLDRKSASGRRFARAAISRDPFCIFGLVWAAKQRTQSWWQPFSGPERESGSGHDVGRQASYENACDPHLRCPSRRSLGPQQQLLS